MVSPDYIEERNHAIYVAQSVLSVLQSTLETVALVVQHHSAIDRVVDGNPVQRCRQCRVPYPCATRTTLSVLAERAEERLNTALGSREVKLVPLMPENSSQRCEGCGARLYDGEMTCCGKLACQEAMGLA